MALQDPQSGSGDPFLDWYYSQGNPQASVPEYPMPGAPSLPPPPPPPPPQPEKPKQIGGMAGVIETAAAPAVANDANSIDPNLIEMEPNTPPADSVPSNINLGTPRAPSAANLHGDPSTLQSMQPGLGIPSSAFDSLPPLPPTEPPPVDLTHEAGTSPFTSPTRLLDNQDQAFGNLTDAQRVDQQYADLRKMDPTKAALLMADREQARKDFYDARMAEIARHDREEQQRLLQQRMAAEQKAADDTKQLHADAMALANTKIIRDRRSAGQTLGDVFVAALGGLISARTGGPNVGLQMVMKGLDDDVQNQKDEIQQKQSILGLRRNFIADELARGKDLYQAQETYRLAMLEGFKQDALTEANKFDPLGTQAQRRYQVVGQIEAEQRKAIDAFQKNQLDQAVKMADLEGKVLDNAKKRGSGASADQLVSDGKTVTNGLGIAVLPPGAFVPPKGWKGSISDYQKLATAGKAGQDAAAGGEVEKEKRLAAREREMPTVVEFDDQGKRIPFQPKGSQTQVDKLQAKYTATNQIVGLLDQAMSIRSGWSSDVGNSNEKQQLDAIMGAVKIAAKNAADLGAITKSDEGLIEGMIGTTDFTKYRDMSAAVAQARLNFVNNLRVELHDRGLSDQATAKFDIPNVWGAKHTETDAEKTIKENKYKDSEIQRSNPNGEPVKRDPNTGKVLYQ